MLEVLRFKIEDYASSTLKPLYIKPAIIAPTTGANINTQTCWRACPPINNAGARLLAGLTDVPVNGIPKR